MSKIVCFVHRFLTDDDHAIFYKFYLNRIMLHKTIMKTLSESLLNERNFQISRLTENGKKKLEDRDHQKGSSHKFLANQQKKELTEKRHEGCRRRV